MTRLFLIIFIVFTCQFSFGQDQLFEDSLTKIILESVPRESSGVPGPPRPPGSSAKRVSNSVLLIDSLTSDLDANGSLDYVFSITKKGSITSKWYEIVLMNDENIDTIYRIPINSTFFDLDLLSLDDGSINAVFYSSGSRYIKADSVKLSFSIIDDQLIENSTIDCRSSDFLKTNAFKRSDGYHYGFNAFYELEKRESIKLSKWSEAFLLMDGCAIMKFNYQLSTPKPNDVDSVSLKSHCINTLDSLIDMSTRKYRKILKSVKSEIGEIEYSSFGLNLGVMDFEVKGKYVGTLQLVPKGARYKINLVIMETKAEPMAVEGFDWERIKRRKSI
jgi:hypothetical protein